MDAQDHGLTVVRRLNSNPDMFFHVKAESPNSPSPIISCWQSDVVSETKKILITNSPSEEEISTEPKKIDRNSLHAYKHMISQNYDRRIGTTETHYRNRKYQVTQLLQPEVSTDNIQGLHNTEPWSH